MEVQNEVADKIVSRLKNRVIQERNKRIHQSVEAMVE